jgi:lambda repressor-like predicted transcriptional regulator
VPVIRRILADQGVALRPKLVPLRLSEEQIASRYRAGSSLAQLATEAGCSSLYPIRRMLQRAGVPFRGKTDLNVQRGARPQLTEEAMQARYEAGSSLSQIAAVANIHPARVATILHRRGMKLRRRGATRLAVQRAAKTVRKARSAPPPGTRPGRSGSCRPRSS